MNDQLSDLTQLAWAQLWQVTALALISLLLVRVFCRHRPHLAYVLLLLVVAKCLTPPIWSSPMGVFSWGWGVQTRQNQNVASTTKVREANEPLKWNSKVIGLPADDNRAGEAPAVNTELTSVRKTLGLEAYLLLTWACGAIVCAAYVAAIWLRHLRAIRKTSTPPTDCLTTLCQRVGEKIGLKRRVRLLISSDSYGPSCFGVFLPSVVLPEQLVTNVLNENIEPVLAHELIHIRRGDTLIALLQVLAGIVWWFHPLIWLVSRQMTREREKCCDEEVVAGTACEPEEYAQGILEVLKLNRPIEPAILMNGIWSVDVTKERLEAIMSRSTKLHSRTPWFCWVILLVLAVILLPGQTYLPKPVLAEDSSGDVESSEADGSNEKRNDSLEFGPTLERTVNDDDPALGDFLIDLDTGKVFSPADELKSKSQEEFLEWFRKMGVDAMGEGDMLLGIDMIAHPTSQRNWNPHPRIFRQIDLGEPGTPVPITGHGKLPSTYFFKTREGGEGVLQIVAFNTNPQSTKIRYKLVKSPLRAAEPLPFDLYISNATAVTPPPDWPEKREELNKRIRESIKQLQTDARFSLKEGEVLKFVPADANLEPLNELRRLHSEGGKRTVWMDFHPMGDQLAVVQWTYGDDRTVADIFDSVLGLKIQYVQGDTELLKRNLLGDWLYRRDPREPHKVDPREVAVVAKAIAKEIEGMYQFELKTVEQPVYVATGDYQFNTVPGPDGKVHRIEGPVAEKADGEFWVPVRRRKYTGSVVHSFNEFLGVWGEVLLTPIVDEVSKHPNKTGFFLRFGDKAVENLTEPLATATEKDVIMHFTKQTGLVLKKETRPIQILFVSRGAASSTP